MDKVFLADAGLKKKPDSGVNGDLEWSVDGRPLIYAAFNDHGKVLGKLLDAGFDLRQLDELIKVEVQRTLDEPHFMRKDEPPAVSSQATLLGQARSVLVIF